MRSPGFLVYNDTEWTMQVALKQVGPLYYGLVPPKTYFSRSTGAVWFTINASISLDHKLHISDWDAVWPVASIVGSIAIGAITGGLGAFAAAGKAAVAAGAISTKLAGLLVAGGVPAMKALVISGTALGSLSAGAAGSLISGVFNNQTADVSKMGCYAGPPWPFRRNVRTYRIHGGPITRPFGVDQMEIIPRPLYLD